MKKSKILIVALAAIALVTALFWGLSPIPNSVTTTSAHSETKLEKLEKLARDRNRELERNLVPDQAVSDEIACAVFLRFVGEGYRNPQERKIKNKYLVSLGFANPNDQEVLLQHAESYVSISNQIAENSKQYKRGNRNDNALRQLGKNKSKLTKDVVHDLKRTLSKDGWDAFNNTVLNRIKPRVKAHRKN